MCFSLENVWKLVKDFIHLFDKRSGKAERHRQRKSRFNQINTYLYLVRSWEMCTFAANYLRNKNGIR